MIYIIIGILVLAVVIIVGVISYLFGLFAGLDLNFEEQEPDNPKLPKCSKWCHAKASFSKDFADGKI
jgi:hypothetical protein